MVQQLWVVNTSFFLAVLRLTSEFTWSTAQQATPPLPPGRSLKYQNLLARRTPPTAAATVAALLVLGPHRRQEG